MDHFPVIVLAVGLLNIFSAHGLEYLEKPQNQTVCEGGVALFTCIIEGVPYMNYKINDSTDLTNATVTQEGENGTIHGELSFIASAEKNGYKIQCCYLSPSIQSCANPPAYTYIPDPPGTVINLQAELKDGYTHIHVTWTPPPTGEEQFNIDVNGQFVATVNNTEFDYIVQNPDPCENVTFDIVAVNSCAREGNSTTVSVGLCNRPLQREASELMSSIAANEMNTVLTFNLQAKVLCAMEMCILSGQREPECFLGYSNTNRDAVVFMLPNDRVPLNHNIVASLTAMNSAGNTKYNGTLSFSTYDVQNLHVNVNEGSANITADFIENSKADGVLYTDFGPDGKVVNSSVLHRGNCTGTGSAIVFPDLPVGQNVVTAHDIEQDGSLTESPAIITTAVVEHSAGTQSATKTSTADGKVVRLPDDKFCVTCNFATIIYAGCLVLVYPLLFPSSGSMPDNISKYNITRNHSETMMQCFLPQSQEYSVVVYMYQQWEMECNNMQTMQIEEVPILLAKSSEIPEETDPVDDAGDLIKKIGLGILFGIAAAVAIVPCVSGGIYAGRKRRKSAGITKSSENSQIVCCNKPTKPDTPEGSTTVASRPSQVHELCALSESVMVHSEGESQQCNDSYTPGELVTLNSKRRERGNALGRDKPQHDTTSHEEGLDKLPTKYSAEQTGTQPTSDVESIDPPQQPLPETGTQTGSQ